MPKNSKLKRHWCIENDDLSIEKSEIGDCVRQSLPDDLGGYSDIFKLENDLSYIETRFKPVKHLSILSKIDTQEPRLVLTLGLKGQSRFVSNQNQEIIFKEGYTSITAFNSIVGERQYEADQETLQLRFSVGKRWLDKYFDEKHIETFFDNSAVTLLSHRPTSCLGITCANQLLTCKLPKPVKSAFIHGQAISIISSELAALFEDKKPLKSNENEAVQRAYAILKLEFKNPPSVAELANRVGLNESKLKKLFHEFFGDTIYGVLLKIRMELAYQMLEKDCRHISVVADMVGYGHLSNFSTAFSRYFGISPKSISKK